MIRTPNATEVDRFRCAVARDLGLRFEDDRLRFLEEVLSRRLAVRGQSTAAYLASLETDSRPKEIGALARMLTVPETHFFRYTDQFRAFVQTAVPERLECPNRTGPLRILSAGCASGEEAYSIAILVRESIKPAADASILGVDVNPEIVRRARRGRYSGWALRETPADIRQRWFTLDGSRFVVDERLRRAVSFEEGNFARNDPRLWEPGTYDIVFFRNVLMYFTKETAGNAIAHITRALKPGGYLFLGHAETLRGMSDDYHVRHTHETFYYQRKDPLAVASPSLAHLPSRLVAIARRTLSPGPPRLPNPGTALPAQAVVWDLVAALNLLRQEEFSQALEMTERAPPKWGRDPALMLLRAVLLTHRQRLTEAEGECQRLLDVDQSSAGAHYVLALCRDAAHDLPQALSHNEMAIRLDPSFAMAHLHLGLLARRRGDGAAAQQALGRALLLLHHEHGRRLLLFGGGFDRAALIALCRAELLGCERWPPGSARMA
jgi:chemotaxis protein methyltransferase CheR